MPGITARLLARISAFTLTVTGLTALAPPLAAQAAPTVTRIASGLTIPWDVTWVGSTMLFNERSGRLWSQRAGGTKQRVSIPLPKIYAKSEGGLMGMVADPAAASNGYFYTCMSVANSNGSPRDVQVWKWKLNSPTSAAKVKTLLTGIPIGTGRHNGCRLRFRNSDYLYIATGDAAQGTNPQNLKSLAGKVLRIRASGAIPPENPFYSVGGNARYVVSYGLRNVQGLAFRGTVNELWAIEHGPTRDDEISKVHLGYNYGWSPTPGYNESRSMTDLRRYPKAAKPRWKSGSSTVAVSGGAFLTSSKWGSWKGYLAVALLKGKGIQLFKVGRSDMLSKVSELATNYGRIRTVQQGPDGALYFTTSNGNGADGVYKLTR